MGKTEDHKIWELAVGWVNNSLDENGKKELEKIKNSEEVRKALKQAKQIYFQASNAFLISTINKKKNWEDLNSQIFHNSRTRRLFVQFSTYAAVFIIALLTGIGISRFYLSDSGKMTNNKIEMEWGQMGKMTLSDGSQVWLNAGTTIEYPTTFDKKKRSVVLDGEAQFKVAHNQKIPFEVRTKSGIIKVYGTTFNVSSYNDDPELIITLIEGKITVENGHGNYLSTLSPSEQLIVDKQTGKASLKKVDTEFYSSWIDGKILLNETKLSDLTMILRRWYNVDIQIIGEDTGDIRISGTISKGKPLDLFLKILERMYGIQYKLISNNNKKDEIIIY